MCAIQGDEVKTKWLLKIGRNSIDGSDGASESPEGAITGYFRPAASSSLAPASHDPWGVCRGKLSGRGRNQAHVACFRTTTKAADLQ
jgi:hypothetical protein